MSKLSRQNTDQFYISFTVTYATRKKKKAKYKTFITDSLYLGIFLVCS